MPNPQLTIQANHREPKLLFGCVALAVSLLTMPLPTMDRSVVTLSDQQQSTLTVLDDLGETALARYDSARGLWQKSKASGTFDFSVALPQRSFQSEVATTSTRAAALRTLVTLGVRLQV